MSERLTHDDEREIRSLAEAGGYATARDVRRLLAEIDRLREAPHAPPVREAGEVVCEVVRAMGLYDGPRDLTDLDSYADAVLVVCAYGNQCAENAVDAAEDRRDDEREYARSRGVR